MSIIVPSSHTKIIIIITNIGGGGGSGTVASPGPFENQDNEKFAVPCKNSWFSISHDR